MKNEPAVVVKTDMVCPNNVDSVCSLTVDTS